MALIKIKLKNGTEVEANLEKPNECKCGKTFYWGLTKNNKHMPVTLDIKNYEGKDILKNFIPHWADCPHAKDFKKG